MYKDREEGELRDMLVYLQMIKNEDDRDKFMRIYHRYVGLMFHIASKYLINDCDREDAVQMAFESIIRNISKLSDFDCPQTHSYIVITIESKSIDVLRGIQTKTGVPYDDNIEGINITFPGDHGLADALTQLPARYREILLLRYDCGYTTKDLASMLGLSRGNVQKLIWRAKAALSEAMEERTEFH